MKRKHATEASILKNDSRTMHPAPTPSMVLKEIFDLLEEYAPIWYTEELHNRAMAALSNGNQQRRVG